MRRGGGISCKLEEKTMWKKIRRRDAPKETESKRMNDVEQRRANTFFRLPSAGFRFWIFHTSRDFSPCEFFLLFALFSFSVLFGGFLNLFFHRMALMKIAPRELIIVIIVGRKDRYREGDKSPGIRGFRFDCWNGQSPLEN